MPRRTDSSDNGCTVWQHNLTLKQNDAAPLVLILQDPVTKGGDIEGNLVLDQRATTDLASIRHNRRDDCYKVCY